METNIYEETLCSLKIFAKTHGARKPAIKIAKAGTLGSGSQPGRYRRRKLQFVRIATA